MLFWKKCLLVICFIGTMYVGGMCLQNETPFLQGFGLIIVIFSFILLYTISRVMWFALSFMQSFFLIGSITVFILYCFGALGEKVTHEDFSVSSTEYDENYADSSLNNAEITQEDVENLGIQMFGNDITDTKVSDKQQIDTVDEQKRKTVQNPANESFFSKIKNAINNQNKEEVHEFNPMDYDYVEGNAKVITGSILKMHNVYIHLLGVDAPDRGQTCADRRGSSYNCGMKAVTWLQEWINNRSVRCYLVGEVKNRHVTGTCFVDNNKYDIAAVVANAGWALAYTKHVSIYIPYEQQANKNRRGLWQGKFYRPWDWRKIQNRKVEIVINKSNSGISGIKNWFKGLF